MVKKAIICDLDGTLCLPNGRPVYDRDYENDPENKPVFDLLQRIDSCNFDGIGEWTEILFVSGRKDNFKEVTRKWLNDRGFEIYPLFMRKEGDYRKDSIVKKEIYEEHIKDRFRIDFVLDDRNQVVEMWREMGLTCFQVAEGDF